MYVGEFWWVLTGDGRPHWLPGYMSWPGQPWWVAFYLRANQG